MNSGRFVRAKVDELWSRANSLLSAESKDVYRNGSNNQYPSEIELVINNSPSAVLGAKTKEQFLIGQGFNQNNEVVVNKKHNLTLYQVGRSVCRTLSRQGGFFLHVLYGINENGDYVPVEIQNLNFSKCRVSKKDDAENNGVIIYKDWSIKGFFNKAKSKWFYPFNNDQNVIISQLKKDAGITHTKALTEAEIKRMLKMQRGQVLYVNSTPEYIYPLAPIDSAYNDADTEYRISVYANNSARHGFQKKKIIVTNNLDTDESDNLDENLKGILGIDGTAGFVHLETGNIEDIDNYLKVIELESDFDDKQFEITEKRIRKNILACYGVHESLVSTTDVNIFGNSGESFKQVKAIYNQKTEDDRQMIRDAFALILNQPELQLIPITDGITTT